MRAKTHQLFGGTFGLVAILLIQGTGYMPKESLIDSVIFMIFVLIGSLLPDIDHYKSTAGRKLPIVSHLIYLIFGHKTITHTLLFAVIVTGVAMIVSISLQITLYPAYGLFWGILSHLIGDMIVTGNKWHGGVPFFYPFTRKKFKFPVTIKINSFSEMLLRLCLLILNVGIVFLLFLGGDL
ncbi:metal-dependent hydrolase [Cytobacillus sp. IB215665]|uniref:metal-dependent hydrolase n=1 Tax=Cytobacillus sp. IB215665 TaxID=3097357 RepID=UPI002A11A176|nr:metal-dependent hydrolase [Cytobacillus sp. IB215665]MDX8367177.1 metal-dependent hydrolase [Cytobacillus sp. IB215665]